MIAEVRPVSTVRRAPARRFGLPGGYAGYLFVAPFLLLFWMTGRRRLAIFYAVILAPIGLFWLSYWPIAMNLAGIALRRLVGDSRQHLEDIA